jgi:hypothetical protein
MKKTEGKKSHASVPLNTDLFAHYFKTNMYCSLGSGTILFVDKFIDFPMHKLA